MSGPVHLLAALPVGERPPLDAESGGDFSPRKKCRNRANLNLPMKALAYQSCRELPESCGIRDAAKLEAHKSTIVIK